VAYLKPALLVRKVFNKIAMRAGLYGTETLAVAGRRTGEEQTIPVIPAEYEGARYIVSTRGESEWVRNARAAGELELRSKSGTTRYRAVELAVGARGPIIDAYRKKAGRTAAAYWNKLPDAADHPVFRLDE